MSKEKYIEFTKSRNITRLCHFTKTKNLPFILGDFDDVDTGIIANLFIEKNNFHEKNDLNRFDGKEDYICTSIQYPNSLLFSFDRDNNIDNLFNNWVILEINPYIIDDSSLFSQFNAAFAKGKYIKSGVEAYKSIFDNQIRLERYSGTVERKRSYKQLINASTDIQAEVMIYKKINKKDIMGMIFENKELMIRELLRLKLSGINLDGIDVKYSQELYERKLYENIRNGIVPKEYKMEDK